MKRLFCLALILVCLGGCGGAGDDAAVPTPVVGDGTAVPTRTVDDVTDSTRVVEADATAPPPDVGNGTCGEIALSGSPARPANEDVLRQAGNCLARAFQDCSAASLTIRDTTNNLVRQFTVLPNGTGCALRQALQTDPNAPPAVVDCQRVRAYTTALVVEGCSHLGDYTLAP